MISNVFTLVLATATIANGFPLFRRESAPAQELTRRADNSGQLAQGSNFYFQSLHIEDACTPGQVACVSGNYATCSGEANWEITPCATGTTCLATPSDSTSGITVQCTTQDAATTEITNAGGDSNVVAADFHVVNAPFQAETVPTATESSAAPSATETAIATESGSAAATDSASATATETPAPTETCIPEEGGDGEPEQDSTVSAPTVSQSATETAAPTETCTEEPLETETITVILVPVPSQSGVFSTTTLFPSEPTEAPSATEVSSSASETALPASSSDSAPASESTPAGTETATESVPTETVAPSDTYGYPSENPTDSAPSDTATESSSSSDSSSASETSTTISPTTFIAPPPTPSETVTSITLSFPADGSNPSIPPLNTGSQPTPPIVVVGIHFIPANGSASGADGSVAPSPTGSTASPVVQVKRGMQKKIRRV